MTPLTLKAALIATLISALVVFLTRAFPFIVFSYRDPPRVISFIEKYIPPMIMAVLVVYCFKDVEFASRPWGLPSIIASALMETECDDKYFRRDAPVHGTLAFAVLTGYSIYAKSIRVHAHPRVF